MTSLCARPHALLLVAPLFLLAGCGGADNTDTTAPTTLAPANVTEDFAGGIEVGGSAVHPFPVAAQSTITVTLVTVGPLSTLAIGLGVGTWDGTNCTLVAADNNAREASALSGTVAPANYCAAIFDNGNMTQAITYAVRVQRPGA